MYIFKSSHAHYRCVSDSTNFNLSSVNDCNQKKIHGSLIEIKTICLSLSSVIVDHNMPAIHFNCWRCSMAKKGKSALFVLSVIFVIVFVIPVCYLLLLLFFVVVIFSAFCSIRINTLYWTQNDCYYLLCSHLFLFYFFSFHSLVHVCVLLLLPRSISTLNKHFLNKPHKTIFNKNTL